MAVLLTVTVTASIAAYNKEDRAILADVDGQRVYDSDLEKIAAKALSEQRERLYHLQKQKLEEYVDAVLLTREAKKSGVSVATLLDREIHSKIMPITDDEIEVFYNSNRSRLGVDLRDGREQIREYLRFRKTEAKKTLYLKSLRFNSKIETYLKAPPRFRVEVPIKSAPFKGPVDAPVTIVKFEDYQCPFCREIQPILRELFSRYGGKIRLVHKDLPLDAIHPQARQAAEAARCAGEQGKFWIYHDALYANAPEASQEMLTSYAKEVGLDVNAFDHCLGSGKFKSAVQRDLMDGAQLGVTGTPTLFINGREISGKQPLETFTAILDEEVGLTKNDF
ncbi:MAG: thioredoxin domain-containing protein [Candidatus Binatia bacterium]